MSNGPKRPVTVAMDARESAEAPHDWDRAKTQILASNTAQGVHKHLRTLESNRERVLPRWIWELLQNARDVSDGNASLIASVEWRDDELTFCHNGRGFEPEEITHLIYYGSTKLELADPIGQFGSGFLATHLLSRTIDVSGHLTDGQTFAFRLDRSGESVADLQSRMDASFEAFKTSLVPATDGVDPRSATRFRYPIDKRALKAVDQGERALELAGPYVTAFNQQLKRIEFLTQESGIVLELRERPGLADVGIGDRLVHIREVEVEVSARASAPPMRRSHVVAELDGVAVAIPFERRGEEIDLAAPTGVPKLLLGFPLIGTEDFSLPVVVHSLRFSPTEERDGVYLGQNDDQVNQENQAVIEQACGLLLSIAGFAAESGWSCIHVLAEVPRVREKPWLNKAWLRGCLRSNLVDRIRATPLVLNESGAPVAPNTSTLPTADSPEAVDRLWSLARALTNLRETLPRQVEAPGWCDAAQSWAALRDCRLAELEETMNGRDLAGHAEASGSIEALQAQLADADAVPWLSELHGFLSANGFDDALRSLRIVPAQNGEFSTLPNLHRDRDIPSELKEIAQLVGWDLRAELRDTRFDTLSDEPGAGDFDSDLIIRELIDRLRGRMEGEELDGDAKDASVALFGWIAAKGRWPDLEGFPAFSRKGKSLRLRQHEDDASERPLAPVGTWPEPLQEYKDLFPKRHTLADDFAAAPNGLSVWSDLEQRGFLRTSVLYARADVLYARPERFDGVLPDGPLPEGEEHRVDGTIEVTDIAFRSKKDIGVLPRVRQSQKQARLFWGFLTRWLAIEDAQGLETQESMCVCGSPHRYYPAAWLVPLVRTQWVPLSHRRTDFASARSLANLLRDSDWSADLLRTKPSVALLKALGIGVTELIKELVTTDDQQRTALDDKLSQLLTAAGAEWERLLPVAAEKLEEYKQGLRTGRTNQRVGKLVEDLVKEILEDEGFDVQPTGRGHDYEIEPGALAEDEQILLKLTRDERTWFVEIKSTRNDGVRMTSVQAREAAAHRSRYLLCVVPISGSEDPDEEAVRQRMRFVDDIGHRLKGICAKLDNVESVRESATEEEADGLRLELDPGSPRIRVDRKVWEDHGFGLLDLSGKLRH